MPGDDDDEPEGKTWDPASELDPVKLQAEGIAVMREAFARMDADKRERLRAELDCPAPAPILGTCSPPPTPTLGQVADRLKRIWGEIQRISPDAPVEIKVEMFRALNMAWFSDAPAAAADGKASLPAEVEDADLLGPPHA